MALDADSLQCILAGKHERSSAAIAIQKSAKEQLQQEMGTLTASQDSGLQDGSAGEEEEVDVVLNDNSGPIDLTQFGKAWKVLHPVLFFPNTVVLCYFAQ